MKERDSIPENEEVPTVEVPACTSGSLPSHSFILLRKAYLNITGT